MRKFLLTLLAFLTFQNIAFAADTKPLVIYSGRSEATVGPLYKMFTDKTGIKVDVRYNTTGALATQALAEGKNTPADVFFFQETGYLGALGKAGLVQPLPTTLLNTVDSSFQDPNKFWVATSARARVLVYNTEKVKPEDLPKSLKDLPDPKWKGKLGWAPSNASLQAHVSALRHIWGEEETKQWLERFVADKPVSYAKNAEQVLAVGKGEVDMAWANHYYLYQLKKQQPNLAAANYHFTAPKDAGNILMLSGAGISQHSTQKDAAEKFVAFLLSKDAQNYLAGEVFEYPTLAGIATHADIPPISSLNLAPINQDWLSDVEPTLKLLQQVGAM